MNLKLDHMHYLLDTSALLAHYRQETGWEEVQALFENHETEIVLASVTLAEFSRRLHDLGVDDAQITRVLDDYRLLFSEVVAIDGVMASAAYQIGRLATTRLPLIDSLIAAAAQVENAVLVHRDLHMSSIPAEVLQQRFLSSSTNSAE